MSDITTTTTTTTAVINKPKQYTFGVSESMKAQLAEFRMDFTRPAAVKNSPPVPMSEKECLEVLFQVASDRRFKTVEVIGEDGLPAYDADGMPEFKTLDLIGDAWEAIKVRDYSPAGPLSTVDQLSKSIRSLLKQQGKSEAQIEALIASITHPATA